MTCLIDGCVICRVRHASVATTPVVVPGPALPERTPGESMRRTARPHYVPEGYHYAGPLDDGLRTPVEFLPDHRRPRRRRVVAIALAVLLAFACLIVMATAALADDPEPPAPAPTSEPQEPTRPEPSAPPAPIYAPPPAGPDDELMSADVIWGRGATAVEIIWT